MSTIDNHYYLEHKMLVDAGFSKTLCDKWREKFGKHRVRITEKVVNEMHSWPKISALGALEYRMMRTGKIKPGEYVKYIGGKPAGFLAQLEARARREGRIP